MNRNGKKSRSSLLMIGILILAVVAGGCRDGVDSRDSGHRPAGGMMDEVTAGQLPKDGKYDPVITLTYLRPWGPDVKFQEGEDQDNNGHTRWAKDKLGIQMKNLWVSPSTNNAFETKLRLSLASDAEMPDIISYRGDFNLVRELIESGKFLDAGELFDKYASDTWKDAVEEDPTVWYPYMQDGKRIGIPILDYAYNSDPVMWIREDWMMKFGFQAPKTLSDLEIIMEAFTNQDPDGNGEKDTYGLTFGFKNWVNTWMSDAGWVFGAYGTMPNQWNLTQDGKLEYGSISPGAKQALEKLQSWMGKGYLSEMAGWYDEAKAVEEFTAGRAGIVVGPHWMPAWPLADVKQKVKGARIRAYPIPSGEDGRAGRHGTSIANGVILINKDMEHPEAFFTYQNYLFDHFANPEVGSEFENGLAGENEEAIADEGDQLTNDAVHTEGYDSEKYTVTFDGARIPSLNMATLLKLAYGGKAVTPFEKKVKSGASREMLEAAEIVMVQRNIAMNQMFTGPPTETMNMNNDILSRMEKDTFSQIIYGKISIDYFDTFLEKWKAAGGDQITREVNEWYRTVNEGQ
ncbi:extracellular solute-binding protein [Paenibacillus sp. Marseille-P2973]|uniref:extracellular solute-binding protein n=1 Tax=Paenibacillus sp. Marseille-P2973 TaxID=1871032 RepID=UPI001B38C1E7|nr:extracellular solute-binding protein [Paenibacillus sp. Marseille-P2973]MBQ4900260.1 extracellular solute-binding protein [Paenibacillus sp. Marseille-P2973]